MLIYEFENNIKPVGGPLGYLYNIKEFVDNSGELNFIECSKKSNSYYIKFIPKFIRKILENKKFVLKSFFIFSNLFPHRAAVNLNPYDLVHFHSTQRMYEVRDSLSKYKGIVLLTSHSPKVPHKEIEDYLNGSEYRKHQKLFEKYEQMDKYAFERADYIVFPCEFSEEPYFNNWSYFKTIKRDKGNRIKYLVTGIKERRARCGKKEIRDKYKIPNNAFVISYIGRHSRVKGYDLLKKFADIVLMEYEDIYFLIAGNEGPESTYNNLRWIEVGWTDDPYSIINACDLFILPNRETYFDLVLLEVLSIGKCIFLSNRGGNKYFEKFKTNGIRLFDNLLEDGVELLIELYSLRTKINEYEKENKKIFHEYFTNEIFYDNYIKLLNELLETKEAKI